MVGSSQAARAWWTACAPLLLWALPALARAAGTRRRWGVVHRVHRAWAGLICLALGVRLRRSGIRHAAGGPFIVLALHEGLADAAVLIHSLPLDLRFIARDELLTWPHVGQHLRRTRQLIAPMQPSAAAGRSMIRASRAALARGESVVVFPQGSILGLEIGFEAGAVNLARRLGAPILPVVLSGTHRVWEYPFSPLLRFGQAVQVEVLRPIPMRDLSRSGVAELTDQLSRRLKARVQRDGIGAVRRFRPERDGWWDGYPYRIDPAFPALAARVLQHRAASLDNGSVRAPTASRAAG